MNQEIISCIENTKIIVIVRRIYGEQLLCLAQALVKGGIRNIEVTFDQSDPDAPKKTGEAIELLCKQFGSELFAGAGTVLTTEQVDTAARCGAKYIISPNTDLDVIKRTKELGLISIPGAMTPSEILAAHKAGADFVKVFPAIDLGLGYLKNIRAPISHVKLVATAGVTEENFQDFLAAGYCAAGISGRLTDMKLIQTGNYDELTRRAKVFLQISEEKRSS